MLEDTTSKTVTEIIHYRIIPENILFFINDLKF